MDATLARRKERCDDGRDLLVSESMQNNGAKSVDPPASTVDADVTRNELHFRRIDIRGFRRSDGLFEVEGRVVDRKPHDFEPIFGQPISAMA